MAIELNEQIPESDFTNTAKLLGNSIELGLNILEQQTEDKLTTDMVQYVFDITVPRFNDKIKMIDCVFETKKEDHDQGKYAVTASFVKSDAKIDEKGAVDATDVFQLRFSNID
jgi:hypothetical protein